MSYLKSLNTRYWLLAIALATGLCCPARNLPGGKLVHHVIDNRLSVDVYLPAGYDTAQYYRTIYFNDGETIFQPAYGWSLQLLLDELIAEDILEPVIVVAIYAAGNRLNWYNPYHDEWIRKNWGTYQPQADEYTDLLQSVLIPFIEKKYTVARGSNKRAIFGCSMGGLYAGWAAFKYPAVFGFSAALSPSYWVADYAILRDVISKPAGSRLWFDIGTAEWQYYIPLYKKLQEVGYLPGTDCFYYEIKGGEHTAADWIKRIRYPLIAFAGNDKNYKMIGMQLVYECIPSLSTPGRTYRRINAIASLANGIRYTLANTAKYRVLKGDIRLLDDGTIIQGTEKNAAVEIKFEHFRKRIRLRFEDCQ